jgi:hypothetical protein
MIQTYLGYKYVAIQTQLMGMTSLLKENSGQSAAILDSTHCINTAILYAQKITWIISVKFLIVLMNKLK